MKKADTEFAREKPVAIPIRAVTTIAGPLPYAIDRNSVSFDVPVVGAVLLIPQLCVCPGERSH